MMPSIVSSQQLLWRQYIPITIILLTIFNAPSPSNGYRILGLFPFPAISHNNFFHPIGRALVEAGHNVTMVSYFPDKNPPENYTDIVLNTLDIMTNGIRLDVRRLYLIPRHYYTVFIK